MTTPLTLTPLSPPGEGLLVKLLLSFTLLFIVSCSKESGETEPGNNIVYGDNIIGNGEQTFDIKDRQYLRKGTYLMKGWCYITPGSTLTIEAGTIIKGDKDTQAALIVEPGGQLIAQGTVDAPIIFTSNMPAGQRRPGDWGGLILCGRAPNNQGIMPIEGGPRTLHGGNDSDDNSGVLSYVRVEFAGYPFKRNQEINGVTFASVGSGTQIDHLQVSYANDDAFEWFGGTVSPQYLVAYHTWDDDFDLDNGYTGTARHLLGVRHPQIADISQSHAFECNNNSTDTPALPLTSATFEDVLILGPLAIDPAFENTPAYINSGTFRPDNQSQLGLYGPAIRLGKHTKISFRDCVLSGYPSQIEGTPEQMHNVTYTNSPPPPYPEWTKRWCNFDPQHTQY